MLDTEKYQRRIDRERRARKEAERLLEEKSAALYEKNLELFALSESLEKLVAQRTAQMQKARDDALNALKVKTDFIANMSHELRTPMNGVLGVLTLMQNEALSADQLELLEVAESSGKQLLDVINDILDFSKIEANKISIELAPLEIRPYIKKTVAPFVLQGQEKGLDVRCIIDPNIEPALYTDKLRLTQIITNLMSNALKFTHQGEVILCFSKHDNSQYRLVVSDTGIGISQKNLNAVFAAFEQADTSITREFGGTGLGMNITKRLVDMLGGSIDVESDFGKGTSFTVNIGMQVAEITAMGPSKADSYKQDTKCNALLLVEDHKVNQMIATRLLESWGFEVTLATNGLEATEIAKQDSFNAILMDLQMPIMGGIEAAKILRHDNLIQPNVPIIAMTAHNSPEHIEECLQAGMQDHVSKPLDKERLLQVLETHLATEVSPQTSNETHPNIQIANVDVEQSLARLGGDWPLLQSLINSFLTELVDFHTLFNQIKADGMVDMGISMLHKIKGSGSNLGMNKLADIAATHERLLIEDEQWPTAEIIEQISSILAKTTEDFSKVAQIAEKAPHKDKIKVSHEKIAAQILLIKENVKQDVFAAEDALNVLLTFDVNPKLMTVLGEAEAAMHSLHTDAVISALTQAQQMLEQ